jgi:hypothetical protein
MNHTLTLAEYAEDPVFEKTKLMKTLAKFADSTYFLVTFESKSMKAKLLSWRNLRAKFVECMRDERGIAMTEYLIITGIMVPAAYYLFYPDNGFYSAARSQYNTTTLLLMFPGP